MRCEDIQSRLTAYADGELPPDERLRVRAHLRGCAGCQAALARVDRLAAALLQTEPPPVPAGLTARVMAAARTRRVVKATADWSPLQWWRMTPAPMHAAAAVVFVIGLTVGLSMGWTILPAGKRIAGPQAAMQADPLDSYNLDYFSDAPNDSLAGVYVALVSGRDGEGR